MIGSTKFNDKINVGEDSMFMAEISPLVMGVNKVLDGTACYYVNQRLGSVTRRKMNKTKEILITSFALFSMFFGAGNLILPPFLGVQAGNNWWMVTLGFVATAVIIPILAILAHAKIQGTLWDFAKKVSPLFATIYCFIIYIICVLLPAPRLSLIHI